MESEENWVYITVFPPGYRVLRETGSDGKVRFGPVLGLLLLNPEPDLRFSSGNIPEP
jgi:hypothetical protein